MSFSPLRREQGFDMLPFDLSAPQHTWSHTFNSLSYVDRTHSANSESDARIPRHQLLLKAQDNDCPHLTNTLSLLKTQLNILIFMETPVYLTNLHLSTY